VGRPARQTVETPRGSRSPFDHELSTVAARRATRNPFGESAEDEITTVAADAGTDAPVATPTDAPSPAPAPAKSCSVKSGPTFDPTGAVTVTTSGGKKKAKWKMSASFKTDAPAGSSPSCCEVHQFIKWDKKFHDYAGGPPHSGFPSGSTYDTWYEDRDKNDKRYGHRSGAQSDPVTGCGDEYKTGTTHDQANGDEYCGNDNPDGPTAMTGTYTFKLKVVDVCNGDAVKTESSEITVSW